ncbi:hypothetical protein GALL_504290 [mine drainage metagenome]|uniref:Uncharacterized protein n=1 Tax=mine drainage metagenome TaxID=410659 RepID=A0A1J5PJL1_9ZZZZ
MSDRGILQKRQRPLCVTPSQAINGQNHQSISVGWIEVKRGLRFADCLRTVVQLVGYGCFQRVKGGITIVQLDPRAGHGKGLLRGASKQ